MAIVQSFGALQASRTPSSTWGTGGGIDLYDRHEAYATLYATQPNVRTCVDFLARNIAQLGLHVFRRVSDTDRVRLVDHDLARWIGKPNPTTTRYRLTENLMGDLGIYFEAYWLKVRYAAGDGRPAIGLVRLPAHEMRPVGGLLPRSFEWTRDGRVQPFPRSEIVFFNGYNPLDPLRGLSPLETLRRVLAEEAAAGEHRESYWRNAGRHEGIIELTKDAPNWTEAQQQKFRREWQEFAGGGAKVGQAAVLPKGMTYKAASFSAKDSEYLAARKLTREECAAAYHIPLPMVGILEHATFSNIKEQHKQLYQDSLGPWLEMIQEEVEAQLLVESEDTRDVYVEFNIADKLKGSFEEQATALQQLVGRPVMTANEGRARLNLPQMTDDPSADQLAAQQGGPAGAPPAPDPSAFAPDAQAAVNVIAQTRARQRARLLKVPAPERAAAFIADLDRYNQELIADLTPIAGPALAVVWGRGANLVTLDELRTEATHA